MATKNNIESCPSVSVSKLKGKIWKEKPRVLPQITSGTSATRWENFEAAEIHVSSPPFPPENGAPQAGEIEVSYPFPPVDGAPQSATIGETRTTILSIQNVSSTNNARLLAGRIDSSEPKGSFTLCHRGSSSSSASASSSSLIASKNNIESCPSASVSKLKGKICKEKPRVLPQTTSGTSETKWENFEAAEIHVSSPQFPPENGAPQAGEIEVSYRFPPVDGAPQSPTIGETRTTILSIQNVSSTNNARLLVVRIDSSEPKGSFTLCHRGSSSSSASASSSSLMASKNNIESCPSASVSKLKGKIWKEKPRVLPQITSGTSETKWENFEAAEIHVSSPPFPPENGAPQAGEIEVSYPFPPVDGAPQSPTIGETRTTILSIQNVSSTNNARLVAGRIDSSEPKGSFTLCQRGSSSSSASASSSSLMASKNNIESCPSASVSKLKGKIWKEKPRVLPQITSGTSETKWENFEAAEIHVSSPPFPPENGAPQAGEIEVSYPFPPVDGAPQSATIGETRTTILSIQNVSSTNNARLVAGRIDSSEPKGSFTLCHRGSSSSSASASSSSLIASKNNIESCPSASVSKLKGKIWKEKPRVLPQTTSGTSETKWENFEAAEIHVSSPPFPPENGAPQAGEIEVSYPFPPVDGAPQSATIGEIRTTILSIQNVSSTNNARLVAVKIDSSEPKGSFTLCHRGSSSSSASSSSQPVISDVMRFPGNTGSMKPGRHIMLDLSFTPKRSGLSTVSIVVDIGEKEIVRTATLLALRYTPRLKQDYDFPVPDHLKERFRMKRTPEILLQGLSEETYCEYFSTLLYLEDLHLKEMSEQSIKVKMRLDKESQLLVVLKLQGRWQKNSGGRSLSILDHVHVKDPNKKGKEYKGCINKVDKSKVFVRFEKRFYVNSNIEYEARFSYNRSNIIRGHHAIAKIHEGLSNNFLFPTESPATTVKACTDDGDSRDIALDNSFNPLLNSDQISAVMGILKCSGSPTYLVYGKPRTGTTATISEAIQQIHKNNPNARVLACTPFNSTSDSLLKRFIGSPIQDMEIFRLNAKFRDLYHEVPPEIYPYCRYNEEEETYYCPPLQELREYKLIVSTYMSTARLRASGLHAGHFTHIFLDTAGLGSEPETMVAVANFATDRTVVVVSGNLGKLAHEISCPMARKFGLSKSYLKRLTELPFYSLGCSEGKQAFVTKLEKEFDDPLAEDTENDRRGLYECERYVEGKIVESAFNI